MGSHPRDGLFATFCLSLSTSNKLRPNHCVGMLMLGAPGAAHRGANLRQRPTGYRRRKWSFDSWTLSVWRGDQGVERPFQPGSAHCFGSVGRYVERKGMQASITCCSSCLGWGQLCVLNQLNKTWVMLYMKQMFVFSVTLWFRRSFNVLHKSKPGYIYPWDFDTSPECK